MSKPIHCKTVLATDGAFCGVRGKNLHFTRPGHMEDMTCKRCIRYFEEDAGWKAARLGVRR